MNWTPEQEAAIRARARAVCVDAGAGSGKTRVLVDRIVHLIEQRNVSIDQMVAITFTENAASEMKARLRAAFRKKAPGDNPEELSRWREMERRIDGARISTIHTFCSTLLRENALHIGLDPDFVVLADADAALLLSETVNGALDDLMERGDPVVLRAAEEWSLQELTALMEDMLHKRSVIERLGSDCALDDPEALRRQWKDALRDERQRRLEALPRMPRVRRFIDQLAGFAGACAAKDDGREQRRLAYLDALSAVLDAPGAAATERALNRIITFDGGRGAKKNWTSEEMYEDLVKAQKDIVDFAKGFLPEEPDEALEEQAAQRTADLCRIFQHVAAAHDDAKAAVNGLDFDDLILKALHMLRDYKPLRKRVAEGIRHLLIDEFQDTDHVQLEIARLLHGEPGGPDLFIVGDAKQSIYLFRGAEVEVFNEQRGVSEKVIQLDRNFRTIPDLLDGVNAFFAASRLLDTTQDYAPMAAERAAWSAPRIEFLLPEPVEEANVEVYRRAEAELIAARIQEMCDGTARLEIERDGARVPADYGDVAVLLRAMSNTFIYEEALRRAGIPYMVMAGAGFYEQQEVLDVLNLLESLIDPWNEPALLAYLRSPIVGLSDESILRLARCGGLGAAFDQGIEPEDLGQTAEWRRARALLDKLRGELARPLLDLLRRVLEETGYEALLLNQFLGLQKASNVRKLVDLADNFTRTRPATPRAFIAYIREVRDQAVREGEAPMQPEGAGAVTIMTVHKAKGLEFPVVFLPDTSSVPRGSNRPAVPLHRELGIAVSVTGDDGERTAPALGEAVRRRQVEEEAAEHARVLYVAMTRARDCLVLSGAPDPRKGSWLELLDAHFGVTGQRDGAVIDARESRAGRPCHAGEGWSVRVRRTVPRKRAKAEKKKRVALPALDEVKRMVAPLTGVVSARHRFSVSGILNAMAGLWSDEAPGHESAGGVATVTPGRLNPLVRGSLVHRMFELWDFAAPPDTTALLREAEVSRRLWPEVAADLRGVAERFQALPLADRLRRDDGLLRETPFSIRLDEVLINGTIDALLSDGTIIDYKTGVVRDAAQARYEWQLLLYAAALRRLRGVTPDRGILCYVDSGHVHEVALGADEVALAERHALEAVERLRGVAPSLEDLVEFPGDV